MAAPLNDSEPGAKRAWTTGLAWVAGALLAMLVVYLITLELAGGDWRAVEAEAQRTHIASSRSGGGPLGWDLLVQFSYPAAGERHVTPPLRVFTHQDRATVAAEANAWPPGRTRIIYYDADRPARASMVADGGAQAIAVVAALLFPLAAALVLLGRRLLRRAPRPGV